MIGLETDRQAEREYSQEGPASSRQRCFVDPGVDKEVEGDSEMEDLPLQ